MAVASTNGFAIVNGNMDTCTFDEVTIPVPWGHISGKWWGPKDIQPILAIHGWQDNSGTFDNLIPLISTKDRSFLCIDLPGHGKSSHYPTGMYYYIFWDGVHLIRRIVKHYKWQNIAILGHSLGGAIAFLYAASYPQETKSYVSIDIASPSVREPTKLISNIGPAVDKFLQFETLSLENTPMYNYDEMLAIVQDAYKDSMTKKSCEIMMRRGMYPAEKKGLYSFARDPRLKTSALGFMAIEQTMVFASRISCEVLNIRADPGMLFDRPEFYGMVLDRIKENAKFLEFVVLKGTHHAHLNEDSVGDVADAILRFLNRPCV